MVSRNISKTITLWMMIFVTVFGITYFADVFATGSNIGTSLGISVGTFSFYKDTTTAMDSYFWHSPNGSSGIDIWNYAASLNPIPATSSGDHRFTVSDILGTAFTVTLQSSDLTASWVTAIPASAITYTWTDWLGTWEVLTATWTQNTSLDSAITFVARNNILWLSQYSQEITLRVTIPAAQAPASYTGQLIFTY